jgi:hypothetical protein
MELVNNISQKQPMKPSHMEQEVLGRTNCLLPFDTAWITQKTMPPTINSSLPWEHLHQVVT